jgi:hypothetical protein
MFYPVILSKKSFCNQKIAGLTTSAPGGKCMAGLTTSAPGGKCMAGLTTSAPGVLLA